MEGNIERIEQKTREGRQYDYIAVPGGDFVMLVGGRGGKGSGAGLKEISLRSYYG